MATFTTPPTTISKPAPIAPPISTTVIPTGCCPPFDPAPWAGHEVVWKDRLFVAEHVPCVWHVPIGMGRVVTRAQAKIVAAHAVPEVPLMLANPVSPWRMDLLIAVDKPVPGARMTSMSGTFLTRVYDGPFSDQPRWEQDMKAHVAREGKRLDGLYFAYTTCPGCAKAYGHNYVVAFARVDSHT